MTKNNLIESYDHTYEMFSQLAPNGVEVVVTYGIWDKLLKNPNLNVSLEELASIIKDPDSITPISSKDARPHDLYIFVLSKKLGSKTLNFRISAKRHVGRIISIILSN